MQPLEVIVNLAQIFNVSRARIQVLLSTVPAIIKRDIDLQAGNHYLNALAEAGLITYLEPKEAPMDLPVWDGIERRNTNRRGANRDRRDIRRGSAIQPDRRIKKGRRSSD
jgi:hypothetical protein